MIWDTKYGSTNLEKEVNTTEDKGNEVYTLRKDKDDYVKTLELGVDNGS